MDKVLKPQMNTDEHRWIKNRLPLHRSTPAGHEGNGQISHTCAGHEGKGEIPQGSGGFSGLRSAVCGLRSSFIFLVALIVLAMVFTGQVSGDPVIYSQDKRFIDNGDATITDTKTGYMWMKEDSYQYKGHWLSWFEASDYIEELNQERFADFLDWRLPTIKELITLYEADKLNSQQVGSEMKMHMDPIFAKEGSGTLWTSETNGIYNAFGVVFNDGKRFNSSKRKKARRAVRAIRLINP